MRQTMKMRGLAVAAAMLLTVALPVPAQEIGEIDTESPLIDLLLADGLTREQMVGMYEALAVGQFEPPACVSGEEMFDDVPATSQFCSWIEELARRGITTGCSATEYCPGAPVTRAQMAVFVLRGQERLAAEVIGGGSQQIPSGGTGSILDSLSTTFDNGNFHQGTQPHLTVPTSGVYQISGYMAMSSPVAGDLRWCVRRNGGAAGGACVTIRHPSQGSLGVFLPLARTLLLEAGDELDVLIQQNTGSNILPQVFWGISLVTNS